LLPRPYRPNVELLEDRRLLAAGPLVFNAPSDAPNALVLRLNGDRLDLLDNDAQVANPKLVDVTAVNITGAVGVNDQLTVDYSFGGLFSVAGGITFLNPGETTGINSLVVIGTGAESGSYTPSGTTAGSGNLMVNGNPIGFSGLNGVTVGAMAGFTVQTPSSGNTLNVDAPAAGQNRISGTSGGVGFASLTFSSVINVTLDAATNDTALVSDSVTVSSGGGATLLQNFTIHTGPGDDSVTVSQPFVLPVAGGALQIDEGGGTNALTVNSTAVGDNVGLTSNSVSVSGNSVVYANIQNLTVNLLGAGDAVTMTGINPTTSTTVNAQTDTNNDSFVGNFSGDFAGNLLLQHFTNTRMTVVGNFTGQWTVTGSGTIQDLTIDQSLGNSGMVMAEDITNIRVMGNLAGHVTASSPATTDGNIGTVSVGSDFTGQISASGTLNTLSVTGASTGLILGHIVDFVSAFNAIAGSPAMNVTTAGVTRKLVATRADNGLPTPSSVKFRYFYDGTASTGPQITIQVTNGNPNVRFDLSLVSSTNAKFNLARLFANGTSDIRNVSIDGDLLATVSPAALSYFGLPSGTPGGIILPLDALGAVAAEGNVVAGTVQVRNLQAVAFGSITAGGITTLAQNATHVDAAGLLTAGSSTVLANDTYTVPFDEAQSVAFFLNTGPGTFDVRPVLFTDQVVDNHGITATVTASAGVISTVVLAGDGGSIQTAEPITSSITSTGRLGDLTLSSSTGINNVTAPSIFGNINTNGPIFGTIQTTSGDIGQAMTNTSGAIVGTTIINTNQGITGRIISRGNLVSQITSQKAFSGVIAAQGDIGVANINATTHQLVSRFGGILSNGQFLGDIVALGNIVGDIIAKNGVDGRIAAKGHAVAGLLAIQTGILGNFSVSGNIELGSAIVSGGEIGDVGSGTSLSSGAIKSIIAAEGPINFSSTGRTTGSFIVHDQTTGPNHDAIEAIFVPSTFDSTPGDLDLAGLSLILTHLNALHVVNGTLTDVP
jgi:hypothetical protein